MIDVNNTYNVFGMSEKSDRLRAARKQAKFASAQAAADALGITASTYRAHENGQNDFEYRDAQFYGRRFNVDPIWLLTGQEQSEELKRAAVALRDARQAEEDASAPKIRDEASIIAILKRVEGLEEEDINFLLKNIRSALAANGAEPLQSRLHGQSPPANPRRAKEPSE